MAGSTVLQAAQLTEGLGMNLTTTDQSKQPMKSCHHPYIRIFCPRTRLLRHSLANLFNPASTLHVPRSKDSYIWALRALCAEIFLLMKMPMRRRARVPMIQ